jgi:predicted TIM-barrel fold metal-dependent hydrolase
LLIDCHVHSEGDESADEVIKAMDRAGVDKAIIMSPYPGERIDHNPTKYGQFSHSGVNEELQEKSTRFISRLQAEAPDRIFAFAWIEPKLKGTVRNVEDAITKFECRGIKMIPDHWYPHDPKFFELYGKVQELRAPILFHSGILYAFKDSSRYCRPCNYEVLVNFPEVKFALAHISWPWTDECIALYGRFRSNLVPRFYSDEMAKEMQMFIDTSPGTPVFYRREVFRKALLFGAGDSMMFGSDSLSASNLDGASTIAEMDKGIIRELGFSDEIIRKVQSENIERYLKG